MKLRKNRRTERDAVNAARTFFEHHNCVFQEVDLGNDYGKDAYVDLCEGESVTGLCIALQIKGGNSYRRKDTYGFPVKEGHAAIWQASSLPIAGIFHDPSDGKLRWCSISEVLSAKPYATPSEITCPADQVLDASTLETHFKPTFRRFEKKRNLASLLLDLVNSDDCSSEIAECFALAREDARVLILIRHLLHTFGEWDFRVALQVLTHATPHPDIHWHAGNWIPIGAANQVRAHFVWSPNEIARMIASIGPDEMQRGDFGEDIYCLLLADPTIKKKIGEVALEAMSAGNEEVAFWAMYFTIYWAGREGLDMYNGFLSLDRRFKNLPLSAELKSILDQQGCLTLFE